MAIKVITGTLESASPYETDKNGVTTWIWWRIVDSEGRDHVIKKVRAREYMTSHALIDTTGTFAFTACVTPIFLGLKYNGQVLEEHEAWRKHIEGWPAVFLALVGIDAFLGALMYFKIVTGDIAVGLMSFFIMASPILLIIFLAHAIDALFERYPKRYELMEALEKAA